jgi:hypothetical protein
MNIRFDGSWVPVLAMAVFALTPAGAQDKGASRKPDLTGVYDAVPPGTTLAGGLKGAGTLDDIALQPSAAAEAKARDLKDDPAKNCQVIGPFRMMARGDNRIEIVTSADRIHVLFENNALGNMRQIWLRPKHSEKVEPSWMGDSVGFWEGDTLVVDSVGFNDRTWLNDAGAPHSPDLHLTEHYRLLPGGNILEFKMTADDPSVLAKPYTYTRYYQRSSMEIKEDFCGR